MRPAGSEPVVMGGGLIVEDGQLTGTAGRRRFHGPLGGAYTASPLRFRGLIMIKRLKYHLRIVGPGASMKLQQRLKDNAGLLSLLTIVVSLILLPLTAIGLYRPDYETEGIQAFQDSVGDWDKIIFLASILLLLIGLAYFYSYQSNHRKFLKLIETGSKQTFIKNQEDIEYYAWKLGTSYEQLVRMKKTELGIETKKKKRKHK